MTVFTLLQATIFATAILLSGWDLINPPDDKDPWDEEPGSPVTTIGDSTATTVTLEKEVVERPPYEVKARAKIEVDVDVPVKE